ncbi:MAG: S8 family serine peptidase [Bacteroidota bacterium]
MKRIIKLHSSGLVTVLCALMVTAPNGLSQDTLTLRGREFIRVDRSWYRVDGPRRYKVNPAVITVRFKPGVATEAKNNLHRSFGTNVLRENRLGFIDLHIPQSADPFDVIQKYLESGMVQVAEPNTFGVYLATPNDPGYPSQWHLAKINAPGAWDIESGKPTATLAVLDMGLQLNHPDIGPGTGANNYENVWKNSGEDEWSSQFEPNTGNHVDDESNGFVDDWKGWNLDLGNNDTRPQGFHGTAVAGVACAKTNNSLGVGGLAGGWSTVGTRVMMVTVGDLFRIRGDVVDDAIVYAVDNGAKILNMSFGVDQAAAIDSALEYAHTTKGALLVAASGNDNVNSVDYPARAAYVTAVGGTGQTDLRGTWIKRQVPQGANWGSELDVSAPCVAIYTTTTTTQGEYLTDSGTSYAAPQVCGLAALIWSIAPSLTNVQVETIITSTAEKVGGYTYTNGRSLELGYGRINAYLALKYTIEHFSTTLGGPGTTVTFTENITTSVGTTLTILPGTTIKFASSKSLAINGRLVAQGTAGSRIRFTSSSPTGTWAGIAVTGSGASNSVFDYVDVERVLTYGGAALNVYGATGLTFIHSTITNSANYGTTGIYLTNAGTPEIAYNRIVACANFGVKFSNTNGYLYRDTLTSNSTGGVWCYMSSPLFGKWDWEAYFGNNIISGGTYGVFAEFYSNPYIGSPYLTHVGYNPITDNTTARIKTWTYCTVDAYNNWWGLSSPDPTWFQASDHATIGWYPYLYSPPGGGGLASSDPPPALTAAGGTESSGFARYIKEAREKWMSGDVSQARDLFAASLREAASPDEAGMALMGLIGVYSISRDESVPSLVRSETPSKFLGAPIIQIMWAELSRLEGDVAESARLFGAVISQNKGTDEGNSAIMHLFNMYISEPSTRSLAAELLPDLESSLGAESHAVTQAKWISGILAESAGAAVDFTTPGSPKENSARELNAEGVPTSYELSSAFPNPFNPQTTFRIAVPQGGFVDLKVYDMLGREVAVLSEGYNRPGYHTVSWNAASSSASGVYYARLNLTDENGKGAFSKVIKLILLK